MDEFIELLERYDEARESQSVIWHCVSDSKDFVKNERKRRDKIVEDLREQLINLVATFSEIGSTNAAKESID